MNNQIHELWRQANVRWVCDSKLPGGTHPDDKTVPEIFAELIIKECAKVARATPCPDFQDQRQQLGHTWDMAAIEAGRQIVKHFGIEK